MKRPVVLLALLLALGLGGWTLWRQEQPAGPAAFQGYVEGELLYMAPEEAGRLQAVSVRAGDQVAAGAPLFALDTPIQDAQRAEAEARLRQAEAQLADLRAAQQRPEQIAVLRATVERVQASLDYTRVEYERQRALRERGISSQAALDNAHSAFERDRAALNEAERQIGAAQLAARSAAIAAGEAAVRAAASALQQLEVRIAKRSVAAPAAGVVQDLYFRAGETVNAGQPVLALLPPANRKLRFYMPEPLFAQVLPGRRIAVSCDGCAAGITATISFVSRDVEFTPPVIFSDQERAKLVFRVEARFEDGAAPLPLGLPVRVRLLPP